MINRKKILLCDDLLKDFISFQKVYNEFSGPVNHYNKIGNQTVLDTLVRCINDLY